MLAGGVALVLRRGGSLAMITVAPIKQQQVQAVNHNGCLAPSGCRGRSRHGAPGAVAGNRALCLDRCESEYRSDQSRQGGRPLTVRLGLDIRAATR